MSHSGLVVALTCAFTAAILVTLWPFITSGLRESERRSASFWPLCGALAMLAFVHAQLNPVLLSPDEIILGVLLAGTMIIGLMIEWIREMMIGRRLDDTGLLSALLVGACLSLCTVRWLEHWVTGWALSAAFVAGILCQRGCHWCFCECDVHPTLHLDPPDLGVLHCHRDLCDRHPRTNGAP